MKKKTEYSTIKFNDIIEVIAINKNTNEKTLKEMTYEEYQKFLNSLNIDINVNKISNLKKYRYIAYQKGFSAFPDAVRL